MTFDLPFVFSDDFILGSPRELYSHPSGSTGLPARNRVSCCSISAAACISELAMSGSAGDGGGDGAVAAVASLMEELAQSVTLRRVLG